MSTNLYIFESIFLVSIVSLIGVFLLSISQKFLKKILLYLVSFSAGGLLGNVFLHLIPEVVQEGIGLEKGLVLILGGMILSFILESIIHWRHCHSLECAVHVKPVGPLVLFGDALHNIIDGMLIASAYLVDVPLGIATTTAVLFHEIPQEIGDFAVLIHSGITRTKALLMNFFSALTAFFGAAVILTASQKLQGLEDILLPLAAGNFLYIAGVDLLPELHKESKLPKAIMQLLCMCAGIGVMYLLATSN